MEVESRQRGGKNPSVHLFKRADLGVVNQITVKLRARVKDFLFGSHRTIQPDSRNN